MNAIIDTPLPDAVQWAEGMLLTPQHFQQHDIHWNAVLQHRLGSLNPHYWGILELQLDLPRLSDRVIALRSLHCIFPDGTPFILTADYGRPLQLAVPAGQPAADQSIYVCVAMPPRTGAMRVQSTSIRRYEKVAGTEAVIDEMTGVADVYVDRIRPSVDLCLEQDLPKGYQSIPLIELRLKAGSTQLELTRFHPPMLRMGAAAFMPPQMSLLTELQNLRDRMWDVMHNLTGLAEGDGPTDEVGMNAGERTRLSMARHIASSLTMFDAVILDPETAPAQAYRAFAHVVGSMAWVGSNPAPLSMAPYAHTNCAAQFVAAIEYVKRKLGLIDTVWESLPFSRVGDLGFLRRLPEDAAETVLVEVQLRQGQTRKELEAWLEDAQIASDDLMPLLKRRRLPGANKRILDGKEIESLGLRSNANIVRIDSQQVDTPQHGRIDCFRPGRGLLIQSSNPHLLPAAVILQHTHAGIGFEAPSSQASVGYQASPSTADHD